jgi:VanZ family protein
VTTALARRGALSRGVFALAVVLLVYAAASELIQTIPALQRDGSIGDWLADAVGVLLGLLLWSVLARRRPG